MNVVAESPHALDAGRGGSDVAARIERLPMTGYQRKLFAVIASAWLVDQIDVALLTFLLGSIIAAFDLTPAQAGQLAATTFAGQLVGNVLAGAASDRFGRRAVFQVTMVVWGLASLGAAAAWSLTALMVFRFLIGVGVGGEAPVAQAMVSEIVPAPVRGKYIAILEGFWAVGYVLSGAISFFVLPYLGWRWAFVVVGLLSLVVLAVRRTCPGTLVGVSTGAWIEGDADRTLARIEGWRELPDHASVNLSEPGAPAVMERLWRRGIGVEAGLASVADAGRLVALGLGLRALRVMVEIEEQNEAEALAVAEAIEAVLAHAGLRRPVLLHGLDATVWRFVARAAEHRFSTRVGLEDGRSLPGGATAPGNAALVAAAVELFAGSHRP